MIKECVLLTLSLVRAMWPIAVPALLIWAMLYGLASLI